ncbi:unnamed protein product [Staurois parvus]|uniref:Uncharacterized protein n=1 Tax=Staurois parvus TaxID=386267 RepID=A0ABN9AH31_9NEOB|nr:unnamed protein product [Staurois parvus]
MRRPESGTWQSVAMETAAMGGRTGTHDTLWTWQQHEEAVQGAHGRVAKRKQLKFKAIQRPMLKSPPSSSVGRRLSRVQWQSGGAEAASIEGHTQA